MRRYDAGGGGGFHELFDSVRRSISFRPGAALDEPASASASASGAGGSRERFRERISTCLRKSRGDGAARDGIQEPLAPAPPPATASGLRLQPNPTATSPCATPQRRGPLARRHRLPPPPLSRRSTPPSGSKAIAAPSRHHQPQVDAADAVSLKWMPPTPSASSGCRRHRRRSCVSPLMPKHVAEALPWEFFNRLASCLPPFTLESLHRAAHARCCSSAATTVGIGGPDGNKRGVKRSRCEDFNSAWQALFKLRCPLDDNARQDSLVTVDWQQQYWEKHLQERLDEAARLQRLHCFLLFVGVLVS